jgi:hypothetical protein
MNTTQKITLPLVTLLLASCTVPQKSSPATEATIPVVEERISLSPLISETEIESLPRWPSDPHEQRLLLKNIDEIHLQLLAEFRRCQKLGLYTMVTDNDNPTMRISVTLTKAELRSDTLSVPVRLVAERLRDDQRYMYTIPAAAVITRENRDLSPLHYYARLLGEYRRNFPYTEVVSFFHPRQADWRR